MASANDALRFTLELSALGVVVSMHLRLAYPLGQR